MEYLIMFVVFLIVLSAIGAGGRKKKSRRKQPAKRQQKGARQKPTFDAPEDPRNAKVYGCYLIQYPDENGDYIERMISKISKTDDGYIEAFCHLRNDWRTFKLSRIRCVADPKTGEILDDIAKELGIATTDPVSDQDRTIYRSMKVFMHRIAQIESCPDDARQMKFVIWSILKKTTSLDGTLRHKLGENVINSLGTTDEDLQAALNEARQLPVQIRNEMCKKLSTFARGDTEAPLPANHERRVYARALRKLLAGDARSIRGLPGPVSLFPDSA